MLKKFLLLLLAINVISLIVMYQVLTIHVDGGNLVGAFIVQGLILSFLVLIFSLIYLTLAKSAKLLIPALVLSSFVVFSIFIFYGTNKAIHDPAKIGDVDAIIYYNKKLPDGRYFKPCTNLGNNDRICDLDLKDLQSHGYSAEKTIINGEAGIIIGSQDTSTLFIVKQSFLTIFSFFNPENY